VIEIILGVARAVFVVMFGMNLGVICTWVDRRQGAVPVGIQQIEPLSCPPPFSARDATVAAGLGDAGHYFLPAFPALRRTRSPA